MQIAGKVLVLMVPCFCAIAASSAGPRVLPPTASDTVSAAFSALEPEWTLESGDVQKNRVDVVVCRVADNRCVSLVLSDPLAGCVGEEMGPWCVVAEGGFEGFPVKRLWTALGADVRRNVWMDGAQESSDGYYGEETPLATNAPAQGAPELRIEEQIWSGAWVGWLIAVVTVLGPAMLLFGVGWGIGRLTGRRLRSPFWFLLLPVAPVGFVAAIPLFWFGVGTADWFTLALSGTIGLLLGAHEISRKMGCRAWLASAVGLVLVWVAMEGVSALTPEPQISFLEPSEVPWTWNHKDGVPPDGKRALPLYPRLYAEETALRFAGTDPGKKLVYHVGDSMVQGARVHPSHTFPVVLNELQSDTLNVNLGMNGTGTDYQVQLVLNWLEVARPDRVVLYVFPGNDIAEMNKHYPFCDNGPVLDFSGNSARLRCPEPLWGGKTISRLFRTAPPFLLRVAASISPLSRRLCAAYWKVSTGLVLDSYESSDSKLDDFSSAVAFLRDELRQQEIEFLVVVLPWRTAIEGTGQLDHRLSEELDPKVMGRLFDDLDVKWMDAWSHFAPLVKKNGADTCFLGDIEGDVHFNAEGHRVLAEWLSER